MSNQKKGSHKRGIELPPIPDKLYFTIGEVSKLCHLRPHVLRYWEQEFTPLSPTKRRGNRRYYQHKDVVLIRKIRHLLYEQGYTIEGARQQLTTDDVKRDLREKPIHKMRSAVSELEKMVIELEE